MPGHLGVETGAMRQSAVVIGGASGIGLATAERLVEDGWPVAIVDVDEEALATVEDMLDNDDIVFLKADVTDEEEIADIFDQVVDRLGLIGGLVNSAGIARDIAADETTPELFREILDVNLVGSFITCRAALERMGESLAIVNIASVSGLRANRGRVAYGASKAGVKLMSEVLALEFGARSVRVNCVAPGQSTRRWSAGCTRRRIARPGCGARRKGRYGTPERSLPRSRSCCPPKRATSTARRLPSTAAFCPLASSAAVDFACGRVSRPNRFKRAEGRAWGNMTDPVLVEVLRGDIVESVHRGAVAVFDAQGKVVFQIGDIDQAGLPALGGEIHSGAAADRDRRGGPIWAHRSGIGVGLCVASRRAGRMWPPLNPSSQIRAGGAGTRMRGALADQPGSRAELAQSGDGDQLHNNCSGKHSGFLTVCQQCGIDHQGYIAAGHGLQEMVRERCRT